MTTPSGIRAEREEIKPKPETTDEFRVMIHLNSEDAIANTVRISHHTYNDGLLHQDNVYPQKMIVNT